MLRPPRHQVLLILLVLLLFLVWYVPLDVSKEEEIIGVSVSWWLKGSANLNKSVAGKKMHLDTDHPTVNKKCRHSALMRGGRWRARAASPVSKADSVTKAFFPLLWSNRLEHFCTQLAEVLTLFSISLSPCVLSRYPSFFFPGLLPGMT